MAEVLLKLARRIYDKQGAETKRDVLAIRNGG